MIGSRTIQDNGDRTYNVLFIFLSHNEENYQKMDLGTLNEEMEPKNGIYMKN